MMRAFIAIKIPDIIRAKISGLQNELMTEGIRWVAPENIHLTLKFLGDVPETNIEAISDAIKVSLRGVAGFKISLEELGGFPNLRHPKVLWVGVKDGKEILVAIMQKLDKELQKLGFEPESREPVPHLTIGRVKKVKSLMLKFESFATDPFLADKVYLIKSELTPAGPIYTDIKEFSL